MRRRSGLLAGLLAVGAAFGAGCGGGDDEGGSATPTTSAGAGSTSTTARPATTTTKAVAIEGLQVIPVASANHVTGAVSYPQTPPVGGDHAAVWQNCGFYSAPVSTEGAVHALEHGAVWVTYEPSLGAGQVDVLRQLTTQTHVLVSPWADGALPGPVVASAWGRQLVLPSATDPRLAPFVAAFRIGAQSPEPGASCTGGMSQPR